MDIDGTMMIDWNEWREHFLLCPAHNLEEIFRYWKHSSVWLTEKHYAGHIFLPTLTGSCRGMQRTPLVLDNIDFVCSPLLLSQFKRTKLTRSLFDALFCHFPLCPAPYSW